MVQYGAPPSAEQVASKMGRMKVEKEEDDRKEKVVKEQDEPPADCSLYSASLHPPTSVCFQG